MIFREMNILIFLIILAIVEANNRQTNYSLCVDIEVDHPATFVVHIDEGSEIPTSKVYSTIPEDIHCPIKSIKVEPARSDERKINFKGISRTWAKPAFCMPELQVVSLLPMNPKSWMDYQPKCTRVKRCGGCCPDAALSCRPTATETIELAYQVTNLQISNKPYWDTVTVEVHTSCSCECKTKAEDCNAKQTYLENMCFCDCNNINEASNCRLNDLKWWNTETCTCHCREIEPCSEGLYFNTNSCRCAIINSSSRNPLWFEPNMSPYTINGYNQMLRN